MMSLLEKKALVMYKQAEAKWGNRFSPLERERGAETGMSALATPYEYTGQRGGSTSPRSCVSLSFGASAIRFH